MMKQQLITRDERYYTVENASYKIGYLILSYGTLLLITFRGAVFNESNWDFFALVIISSLAATVYQFKNKTISLSWKILFFAIAIMLIGSVVAFLVGSLLRR